jgi:hypothetical protein
MAVTEIVAAGLVSALIQGIQAWMAMARQAGLTDLQIIAMMDEQYVQFQKNISTPLPDPDKEG